MAKNNKRSKAFEDKELEEAFHQMTGSKKNKNKQAKNNSSFSVTLCITFALLIICGGAFLFYRIHTEMNRVIQGDISIADIHVQGMTQADAIKAVNASYKAKDITVTVMDHSILMPSDYVKALHTRKAVRAACDLRITEGPLDLDLTDYLDVDEEQIRAKLATLGSHYNTELQESTYTVLGGEQNRILQVTLGTPAYGLDLEQLYREVLEAYGNGQTKLEGRYTLLEPEPIDLETIYDTYCTPPIDASYDLKTHQIVGGENGYGFDLEAAKDQLAKEEYGTTVDVPFKIVPPAITKETAEAALFQDTLGTFTAKSSSQKNRDVNLDLACKAINGIILYPGDSFSYNEALGERTPEKGYKPAGTYVGNETVNTYGGGICQVSSSLYYSALCAELEIIERTNHGFLPSYMPRGLDATVSWGTLDFKFKNTLDYPIKIEANANGGTTTVTIRSTETRTYRVELDVTTISKTSYQTEYRLMEPGNKEGYSDGDVIITPYTGYYVESYFCKYDAETNKLISRTYIDDSKYKVRNKVVCKIESASPEQPGDDTPTVSPEETSTP